ncbi:MAG TPA: PKD domain-containing protein [Chitinophagaceae bacterium]|nr:PKD domain-containing protein [Chitinophagaceae bacterium]
MFDVINNCILKRLFFAVLVIPALAATGQSYNNIEFIENKGQWDSRVLYKGDVSNGNFLIREGGFTVVQHNPGDFAAVSNYMHGLTANGSPIQPNTNIVLRSHAWNVDFVGASKSMQVVPDKMISSYNNYFIGNDPSKWAGNCRIFQAITLKDVYPNIDVRYYTDNSFLKYDIIVKPGGDVSKIALKYDGVDRLQVKNKELQITTSVGELKESSPYTYQSGTTGKSEINCKYVVRDNIVRFDVKDYDPSATLVIDPAVVFCSFSRSTADNYGFTATYGPDGSMFGGGIVFDNGWKISPGAYQVNFQGGSFDIGIIKLTDDGRDLVYATYVGGNSSGNTGGEDQPHSLVVDPQGNLVIAGRTNSFNYPVTNPIGAVGSGGGYDIVVTKLNAAGNGLVGSTRIGGSGNDGVNIRTDRFTPAASLVRNYGDDGRSEVILDGAGNIYVASCTQSTNFPIRGSGFQATIGGQQDGVVLKFNPALSAITFSSYLGGSGNDAAYVLALAPNGNIYVAGGTESGNFDAPANTAGTISATHRGLVDGFVSIINNSGTVRSKSTYIGTDGYDQVFGIQFDRNGFPYVMGQTTGTWPIENATYSNANGKQFIVKLQPDLSSRVYSTAFGSGASTPNISPTAFLVDRCENVYVSGWGGYIGQNYYSSAGTSGLPVTPDAIKSSTDGKDFYFFVLKRNATAQLFGSFFGENNTGSNQGSDHVDGGTSRFDPNGVIYQAICGNCNIGSRPFYPTTAGAWAVDNSSPSCDLTMLKIKMNLAGVDGGIQSAIDNIPGDTAGCVPLTVDFRDTVGLAQSYEWYFNYVPGNPPDLITTIPTVTSPPYTAVGTYQVMLVAIDPNTCNVRDSSFLAIRAGDLEATVVFTPVKLPPCTAFKYRFDNNSVPPPTAPFGPAAFVWDFGDGSPRVTAGPGPVFHDYAGPGTYNVKLLLQDILYCNAPDSVVDPLSVATNVIAKFTTPSSGCLPYTAEFKNTSDAGETWAWDFGDPASGANNTSTDFEPTHLYSAAGTYTVKLTATNPNTCNLTSTVIFKITVYVSPAPGFSFSPDPPTENTPTVFVNLSSPDAIRFKWDFGDGDSFLTTSRDPVSHQYNATGTFNACLTAYNLIGCDSTICKPVRILIVPVVDIPNAFTPQSGDVNSIVYIRGFGIARIQFIIWNRWGQKVFETNNRFQGWDGRVKGVVQPMDVYAYTVSIEFSDGTKTTKKGDLTLIR